LKSDLKDVKSVEKTIGIQIPDETKSYGVKMRQVDDVKDALMEIWTRTRPTN
jgi:hypothetical protein